MISTDKQILKSIEAFGGDPEDYRAIHEWMDYNLITWQHQVLRHHTGIYNDADKIFGRYITNSEERFIQVSRVIRQHLINDFGFTPTVNQWLAAIAGRPKDANLTQTQLNRMDREQVVMTQNVLVKQEKQVQYGFMEESIQGTVKFANSTSGAKKKGT